MHDNVISITVRNRDDLISKFNDQQLSDELGNYIFLESFESGFRKKLVIQLVIKFKVSDKEKTNINDMIHRYFGLGVKESIYYIKFSLAKQLVLFILGVILIVLAVLTPLKVISEVLLISGWVCVWETVYGLFFVDTKYHVRMKRFKQLSQCKVKIVCERN